MWQVEGTLPSTYAYRFCITHREIEMIRAAGSPLGSIQEWRGERRGPRRFVHGQRGPGEVVDNARGRERVAISQKASIKVPVVLRCQRLSSFEFAVSLSRLLVKPPSPQPCSGKKVTHALSHFSGGAISRTCRPQPTSVKHFTFYLSQTEGAGFATLNGSGVLGTLRRIGAAGCV